MMGRCGRRLSPVCGIWRSRSTSTSACCMVTGPTRSPKKGGWHWVLGVQTPEGGESHRHHGQPGLRLAPVPVAPVNETDMLLFPEGLKALKKMAKEVGVDLHGAYLNLDGSFDSARNRKYIFNAGLIPNIKEHPRNRKTVKRGRKRLFNEAMHALRMRVERTFAWEDKFKRLLLRFERIQQRHYGMKLMAYTLINLRAFCGI